MFPQFDPSKMDPKTLMELSGLIQTLPPDMINRMQKIMHNSMAGFDVRKEMEEFERSLKPGFREKLMTLMAGQMGAFGGTIEAETVSSKAAVHHEQAEPVNLHEARITVLRAVADGRIAPEEAEKILFS